ncbi:putative LOC100569746 [Trichonephila clavipes]|nr:putative LOC100569746 [Trichonephila clavipes]
MKHNIPSYHNIPPNIQLYTHVSEFPSIPCRWVITDTAVNGVLCRAASPFVRLGKGEEKWEAPDHTPRVFSLKTRVESYQSALSPVWCSKLRLTTGVHLALCRDEFCGSRSDIVRSRAKITHFFIPELNNHDVQELWFQQDGATCHTARATIDLLKDTLGDRLISRFGPVNWSPSSCDLTPLDYFLWGYVKALVYADKPHTLDHLVDNIRRVITDIWPQMLEKVIENWTSRLDYIRASRGSPMPEIIFKM